MAWMLAAGKPSTGLDIVLGALALVIVAAFIWAVAIRKPDASGHGRHHWRQRPQKPDEAESEEKGFFQSRRRRRRHKHRPMKPTLAETGGLPPKRPGDEPPRGI